MRLPYAIAVAVALSCACGSEKDDVVDAWKEAGLEPTSFEKLTDDELGDECYLGKVDGLEVTLCRYADAAAAEAARERGLERVGETTGAALPSGRLLLVIADRDRVDPTGRTINKVARAFADRPQHPAAKLAPQ